MSAPFKICHGADFHIRSYEYLDEVKYTIEKFVESIKEEAPDLIYIGGDTFHNKLTVTGEYFDICSKLFRDLSDIAPVIWILGNHDLSLPNPTRTDAVSPVINALGETKHPIHFAKKSTDTIKIEHNKKLFYFHCLSILEEKSKWPNKDTIIAGLQDGTFKEEDVHIAMYHGAINGCLVDNGWTSRGNADSLDIFAGFDFGMLGDIHKFQMLSDRVAYPGSLRQNNFGEDLEKGYLLWEIESKDKFAVERVILPQKRYFHTIEIDKPEDLVKDPNIGTGNRVRVMVKSRVGLADEAIIKEKTKEWYKPYNEVTVLSSFDGSSLQSVVSGDEEFTQDNLRSLDTQRKLITNFFQNENLTEEQLKEILELDKKYNSFIDVSAHRNTIWDIKKLKWSNLFSYGSDNEIDFTKQSGLIGIFGKNGEGKALWTKTPILTSEGWKTIGTVEIGDFVYQKNGQKTKVIAKSPVWKNRTTYKVVFSDGSEVFADSEHLWEVSSFEDRRKKEGKKPHRRRKGARPQKVAPQILSTKELLKNLKFQNKNNWSVENCKSLKIKEKEFLIDPYVFGAWLGDGHSSSATITCFDKEILTEIRKRGYKVVARKTPGAYAIRDLSWRLRELGVLNNKHIPEDYLLGSEKQRIDLLDGLIDTDGCCNKENKVEFCSTKKNLAEGVKFLVNSLGMNCRLNQNAAKLYGRYICERYRVTFTPILDLFYIKRKNKNIRFGKIQQGERKKHKFIVDIKKVKNRETQCIQVENKNGLFLCGKSLVVTHNSSVIDSLAYGLYNSINKEGATKNAEYINFKKKKCEVDIKIGFGGEEYKINRQTTKPIKEGSPPKNEIEFHKKVGGKNVSLNGETKPDTNQNIKNIFGSLEDFVSTSLCPQEGLTKFIDLRGTEKKKIFNKFFDLDFFETKFDLADKDHKVIKGKLSDYNNQNLEEKASKTKTDLSLLNDDYNVLSEARESLDSKIGDLNESILQKTYKLQPTSFAGNINLIKNELNKIEQLIDQTEKERDENIPFNSVTLEKERENILTHLAELKSKLLHIKAQKASFAQKEETASLLKKIPCGDQFPTCVFIEKAHKAKNELNQIDTVLFDTISALEANIKSYEISLKNVEEERLKSEKYNRAILTLENLELKKARLEEQIDLYNKCETSVLENDKINKEIETLKLQKEECLKELGQVSQKITSITKSLGSLEKQQSDIEEKVKEYQSLGKTSIYYELYLKAMGKNGISYSVAAQKLPVVNEEANRILKQVVNYSVSIEDNEEEKSIKLYLIRDKEKTPVELASGAEKTMISLSLRTALWRVTSIPKTPCLFLDEPFGFMEEGKQDAIVKMLQYLKNYFKHIFIITHDSNLKNVVDSAIYIERNEEGFAFCKA